MTDDHISVYRDNIFPVLRALIGLGYYSLSVEGGEHVPPSGPVIYAANHAGWFTVDSYVFNLALSDLVGTDRIAWGVGADVLLKVPGLASLVKRMGMIPASVARDPKSLPSEIECIGIFPEGVAGNCKPFWQAYRLREWKRGFIRLAMARRAPIVPVAILGGEESLPLLTALTGARRLIGSEVPVPLLPLPLPARWRVIFHPPVSVEELGSEDDEGSHRCRALASQVQRQVQETLDREARDRVLWQIAARLARRSAAAGDLGRSR